jgi:hypothetical protein
VDEKKLPEIVVSPNINLTDTFVGVRDNGDGTFSDYRFPMSQLVSAILGANILLAPVLDTPAVENGQATIIGTAVGGANYYEIQVTTNAAFIGAATFMTVDWPKIIVGLTNGTLHYFRARSVNDTTQSPWSNIVTVTPSAIAPAAALPYTLPFTLLS